MVRFEDDKLVIELKAGSAELSVERWTNLHHALSLILADISLSPEDVDLSGGYFYLFDFLDELMPDWKDVKKMVK